MTGFFRRYLLPGFIFQGVVIGGGYATGRELVEFFLPSGPLGGLMAMGVVALIWGLVMAVSFELCRMSGSYDYHSFFRNLLGRFGVFYEVFYFILIILILGVIGAASGEIAHDLLGFSPLAGTVCMILLTGVLAFYGNAVIERFISLWSILLYVVFALLIIFTYMAFGDRISSSLGNSVTGNRWALDGLRYAGYNIAAVPAVFFCLRHLKYRREAIGAGLIGGVIAILPGVFLYLAMLARYPEIMSAPIPSSELLTVLDMRWFEIAYQVILIGTFVQTGVGLLHTVNERIATSLKARNKSLPVFLRPAIACGLFAVALTLAVKVGIIDLIARGYGQLTWGFIAVFVIPVLTVGLYRVLRPTARPAVDSSLGL